MSPRPAPLVIAVVFAILNCGYHHSQCGVSDSGQGPSFRPGRSSVGTQLYAAFAALIVAAGRLADVFGRRRCLLVGSLIFAIASLICGLAPTLSVLVIGRVLQGAGGALMLPDGRQIKNAEAL